MANGFPVTKETYKEAAIDTKLDFLYDIMASIHLHNVGQCQMCRERMKSCEDAVEARRAEYVARLEKLERRGLWDKSVSFIGGVIGGSAAILAKTLFGK